nr:hypothetical protein [Acinetobacter sp. Marseille-Q1620]
MGTYKIQKNTNQGSMTGANNNQSTSINQNSTSNTNATTPNTQSNSNVPPIKKIPLQFTIPQVDISKIKGHLCTQAKAFEMIREKLPNLMGDYYQTDKNGNEHWVDSQGSTASGKSKMRRNVNGKDDILYFYNYSWNDSYVDLKFDPTMNVFYLEKKVQFAPYKVFDKTGNEVKYDHNKMMGTLEKQFNFVMQPITTDDNDFLKDKETKVNQILNQNGYYLAATRCKKDGGCSCKIPIVFKVTYSLTNSTSPLVIRLFEDSERANAANYSKVERMKVTVRNIVNGKPIDVKEDREYDATVTFTHETGHLYGFPDEYFEHGGAVHKMYIDPNTQLVDVKKAEPKDDWKRNGGDNLMCSRGVYTLPLIPAYYLEVFRKRFEEKTGIEIEIKC